MTQSCILLREGLDRGARGAIETQNEAIINTDENIRLLLVMRIYGFSWENEILDVDKSNRTLPYPTQCEPKINSRLIIHSTPFVSLISLSM